MSGKSNKKSQVEKGVRSFDRNILELSSASDGLPTLLGSKCRKCGKHWFPPHLACLECTSDEMERVALSKKGRIYAFTVVEWEGLKPPNYPVFPYAYGFVDLPEGARVLTALRGPDLGSFEIDMEVALATQKVGEDDTGNDIIGYHFEPINKVNRML